MIAWQEAVERAIKAAETAEGYAEQGRDHMAQTHAEISYAWSNIGMMLEAQETAEAEAGDAAT